MKKPLIIAALCMSMTAGALTACGSGQTSANTAATTQAAETQATETEAAAELPAGIAEGPILLTSDGQSADVNVVQTLLKKCELKVT